MPLEGEHATDIGMEVAEGLVCRFDSENGKIKSPEDIFNGGVEFFSGSCAGGDRELAARLTRKNMKSLAYWQAHPFAALEGPEATDQEMTDAMSKL
jgi:hypothetical protein